jgi:hypothetical protein
LNAGSTERPEGLHDDVFDRPQRVHTRALLAAAPVLDIRKPNAADFHAEGELRGGQLLVRSDNGKAEQ